MKSMAADPAISSLPADMPGQYCMCVANRLADNTPPAASSVDGEMSLLPDGRPARV
jgi:hypothetical protein